MTNNTNTVGEIMNRKKFLILVGFITLILILYRLVLFGTRAEDNSDTDNLVEVNSIDDVYNALVETAEAYYLKGDNILYDQYKWNAFTSPEEATNQHTIYSACAPFINQVYRQVFGNNTPLPYKSSGTDEAFETDKIAEYINNFNDPSGEYILKSTKDLEKNPVKIEDIVSNINELTEILRPGDAFLVRFSSGGGHIMMVEEVTSDEVYMIESTNRGGSLNYQMNGLTADYKGATIQKFKLSDRLNDYAEKDFSLVAFIRFINEKCENDKCVIEYKDYNGTTNQLDKKITKSAKFRLDFEGLDIDKTASLPTNSYVDNNGNITYTIKLTNNSISNYDKNITIIENIDTTKAKIYAVYDAEGNIYYRNEQGNMYSPSGAEFVNSGITISDNKITWEIANIDTKTTKTIKYIVKANGQYGEKIISTGTVGDIESTQIINIIGKKMTIDKVTDLLGKYDNVKNANTEETTNGIDFIINLYRKIGIEIGYLNYCNNDENCVFDATNEYLNPIYNEYYNNITTAINENINAGTKALIYNDYYGRRLSDAETEQATNYEYCGYKSSKKEGYNVSLGECINSYRAWNRYQKLDYAGGYVRPRDIKVDNLLTGDIIIRSYGPNDPSKEMAYLFLRRSNGNQLVGINTSSQLIERTDAGTKVYGWEDGKYNVIAEYENATLSKFLTDIVGYNYIVLRPALSLIDVPITIKWNDNNNQDGLRPDEINIILLANGNEVDSHVISDDSNNWTYTFENLSKYDQNGNEIIYTIQEGTIPEGYNKTIDNYSIINSYTPETTQVVVEKIWDDDNNLDNLRKPIEVVLYGNNEEMATIFLDGTIDDNGETSAWTATFNNVPKKANGTDITYTVNEKNVPAGYTKTITGLTITNTHKSNDYLNINDYIVDNDTNIISNIFDDLKVSEFMTKVNTNGNMTIVNKNNQEIDNDEIICTGYKLKVIFDEEIKEYKLSVKGDVLGNGKIEIRDAKMISQHIIDKNIILGEEYLLAADYNGDGNIKMNDVIKILVDIKKKN